MNRIDRLTAILIQLQSKKVVRAREIADRFGISIRTVYRDIRALEDAGVPIGSQAGEGYFLSEGYLLPPVMFTSDEAGALLFGGKLIEQFTDASIRFNFESALFKIKSILRSGDKDFLEALDANISVFSATREQGNQSGENLLAQLQSMIGKRQITKILYHSGYRDEETTRLVEPIGLCFWSRNWHLVAYCHLRQDYRNFRVTRVLKVTSTKIKFEMERHNSLESLITKIWDTKDLKPATVQFQNEVVKKMGDQKYYFGMIEEETIGLNTTMKFLTSSYAYFAGWIMNFTDQATVIYPEALKVILRENARKLFDHYQ
jgi:predicted DNA-binding transcriptional regulator YafY